MKPKQKNPKEKFFDDGRTIVNMNVEGIRGYKKERLEPRDAEKPMELTAKERRAMILALYVVVFKLAAVFTVSIVLVMLFIQFVWFKA